MSQSANTYFESTIARFRKVLSPNVVPVNLPKKISTPPLNRRPYQNNTKAVLCNSNKSRKLTEECKKLNFSDINEYKEIKITEIHQETPKSIQSQALVISLGNKDTFKYTKFTAYPYESASDRWASCSEDCPQLRKRRVYTCRCSKCQQPACPGRAKECRAMQADPSERPEEDAALQEEDASLQEEQAGLREDDLGRKVESSGYQEVAAGQEEEPEWQDGTHAPIATFADAATMTSQYVDAAASTSQDAELPPSDEGNCQRCQRYQLCTDRYSCQPSNFQDDDDADLPANRPVAYITIQCPTCHQSVRAPVNGKYDYGLATMQRNPDYSGPPVRNKMGPPMMNPHIYVPPSGPRSTSCNYRQRYDEPIFILNRRPERHRSLSPGRKPRALQMQDYDPGKNPSRYHANCNTPCNSSEGKKSAGSPRMPVAPRRRAVASSRFCPPCSQQCAGACDNQQ